MDNGQQDQAVAGGGPQPGMMMGRGGMEGMVLGRKGMTGHAEGHGMHKHYRQLVGRLDLLEARMAKIETSLERLIQR